MLMLDADTVLNKLPFTTLVDELAEMHLKPIGLIDEMRVESEDTNQNINHFYIRTGWQQEEALGAKGRPWHQRDTHFLEQQVSHIDVIVEVFT